MPQYAPGYGFEDGTDRAEHGVIDVDPVVKSHGKS